MTLSHSPLLLLIMSSYELKKKANHHRIQTNLKVIINNTNILKECQVHLQVTKLRVRVRVSSEELINRPAAVLLNSLGQISSKTGEGILCQVILSEYNHYATPGDIVTEYSKIKLQSHKRTEPQCSNECRLNQKYWETTYHSSIQTRQFNYSSVSHSDHSSDDKLAKILRCSSGRRATGNKRNTTQAQPGPGGWPKTSSTSARSNHCGSPGATPRRILSFRGWLRDPAWVTLLFNPQIEESTVVAILSARTYSYCSQHEDSTNTLVLVTRHIRGIQPISQIYWISIEVLLSKDIELHTTSLLSTQLLVCKMIQLI